MSKNQACIFHNLFLFRLQGGLSIGFRFNPEQGLHADAVARQQQGQMGPRARRTTQARRHQPRILNSVSKNGRGRSFDKVSFADITNFP